jgi:hypothetical protein
VPLSNIAFRSRINSGLQSLGRSLGPIGSILLRLGLVVVFFWYLCEFASALSEAHPGWTWVLRAASIILLVIFLAIVVIAAYRLDPTAKPEQASMMPFILLNLAPIAAVAIAVRWGTKFTTPLINFTLDILKWANLS